MLRAELPRLLLQKFCVRERGQRRYRETFGVALNDL